MNRRYLAAAAISVVASVLVAGCSSNADDSDSANSALTPAEPGSGFPQAAACERLFKRHASVRPVDMDEGVIRWGCGDVAGVTDNDLGQEYCEYQAVQNGKVIRKPSELTTGPVSCVFTAVFTGAGEATRLKAAMADPANLGVAAATDNIVQMQKGFNGRSAATTLVRDCSRTSDVTKRVRIAACYQAFTRGGTNAARLEQLCKSGNITEAAWTEAESLGAKVLQNGEPGFEDQRDIASCLAVKGAGVGWRNSDPMICSRVNRSTSECSCQFNAVPSNLMGFEFTGWVDDQIPSSCRMAVVNGQPYPYVAICGVSEQEVADLPLNPAYARNIGNFCHDRFGVDLVMKLPLRALQKANTCGESAGFCAEYMGDAPPPAPPVDPPAPPAGPTRGDGAPPPPSGGEN